MSQQNAESGEEVAGCIGCAVCIAAVVGAMTLIGNTIGFSGWVSVVVSLVISLVIGVIVLGVYGAIFLPAEAGAQGAGPAQAAPLPQSSSGHVRSRWTAANSNPLVGQIRLYDRDLARRVKDFQKVAALRPEFTAEAEQSVLDKVREMHAHHDTYVHTLNDRDHPDYETVTREMLRYRNAVGELLRLRTEELQSGAYGGFEYREDLRTVEGHVELLSDEFQGLFDELEADQHRRRDPDEVP